jgi:hypothetical protein
MPIREYYREVWDADAAATAVHTPQSYAVWPWFKELPDELRPFAMGLSPLNGVMLSHRALAAVCAGPLPPNVFCECRLGTALKAAGFQPGRIEGDANLYIKVCVPFNSSCVPSRSSILTGGVH